MNPESFRYLNDFFDKILVLTLPRLTDRIDNFKRMFEGLDYDFFYGVDKNDITLDQLKKSGEYSTSSYRQFYKKPVDIPVGMLCCSLGHVHIYEHIIANNFQKTLILEDDAVPNAETILSFPTIIEELPADWELFYLGYEKNERYGPAQRVRNMGFRALPIHSQLKLNRKIYSRYYPRRISKHIAAAGFHDCTHAYAVTLEGARKLVPQQHPVRFHPDNLLSYMNCTGQLKGYIARPKLFNQLSAWVGKVSSLTSD